MYVCMYVTIFQFDLIGGVFFFKGIFWSIKAAVSGRFPRRVDSNLPCFGGEL